MRRPAEARPPPAPNRKPPCCLRHELDQPSAEGLCLLDERVERAIGFHWQRGRPRVTPSLSSPAAVTQFTEKATVAGCSHESATRDTGDGATGLDGWAGAAGRRALGASATVRWRLAWPSGPQPDLVVRGAERVREMPMERRPCARCSSRLGTPTSW